LAQCFGGVAEDVVMPGRVAAPGVAEMPADLLDRVEATYRILKDHGQFAATQSVEFGLRQGRDIVPFIKNMIGLQ
jgi:hypothetical protein